MINYKDSDNERLDYKDKDMTISGGSEKGILEFAKEKTKQKNNAGYFLIAIVLIIAVVAIVNKEAAIILSPSLTIPSLINRFWK